MDISLLLIGAGKMGGALLERWAAYPQVAHIDVIEPGLARPSDTRISWHKNLESLSKNYAPDVIVFAVKPQQLGDILPAYRARFAHKPLYISIAAGKTLAFFARHLGTQAKVIRAMPNLPATIGSGMTVLTATDVSPAFKETAIRLMGAVGEVEWLDDEAQMDAVTALSGSGPAYVFLFLESLLKAGVAAGLPEGLAKKLAIETLCGSAALAAESSESAAQLRKNVTSPGGTTEAALAVLMKDNALEKLMENAVRAAARRSQELKE